MKACVYRNYGSPDVISVAELPIPVPKAGEVLVKVLAASVNAYDWHLLRGKPFMTRTLSGLFKPKNTILGADIAGTVEAMGESAALYKPGDEVYGCLESCGAGGLAAGGFAEYVCAKETVLAPKPSAISFCEAAAIPMAAATALQGLRDCGKIKPGQSVLINGSSGGVGHFAVQLAKYFGADATGVCSGRNADMVRSIGANAVIDYLQEDFSQAGRQYDLILDVAANHSIADCKRALKPNGACVVVGFSRMGHMLSVVSAGLFAPKNGQRVTLLVANNTKSSDLIFLNTLLEKRAVTPIIDRSYPLAEAAEAIRYVETNRAKGKVVIGVIPQSEPCRRGKGISQTQLP
jgi:NADPH:quinone reductase-like Zn-dependent oxidoreductase